MEGRGDTCYHYVLGNNVGSNGHIAPLGRFLTDYAEENHKTILEQLNWACSLCGTAQYGIDGTCCGLGAKNHLVNRIK